MRRGADVAGGVGHAVDRRREPGLEHQRQLHGLGQGQALLQWRLAL